MLARLKRFSFISIPNDRQFVKRVSEKILMDLAILRGICSLRAEKTFFHGILGGKSSLEARLRTRKVTGRDASLPAPLLATSLGLVGRGTVGALPQTPQGTLSLDPARGRRKGTKSPLDPFSRLSWCAFMLLPRAAFWCFAEAFVCSPRLSVKNQIIPRIVHDSGG